MATKYGRIAKTFVDCVRTRKRERNVNDGDDCDGVLKEVEELVKLVEWFAFVDVLLVNVAMYGTLDRGVN